MPERIGDLLKGVIKDIGSAGLLRTDAVARSWKNAVARDIHDYSRVTYVKDCVVHVAAADAATASEIRMAGGDIISKLKELSGIDDLESIRVKIEAPDPVETKDEDSLPSSDSGEPGVGDSEDEEAEKTAGAVDDERLRGAWKNMILSAKRLERIRKARGLVPCPGCGEYIPAGKRLCSLCAHRENARRKEIFIAYLDEFPYVKLSEFKTVFPGATGGDYERAKATLAERITEKITAILKRPWEIGRDATPVAEFLLRLASLKSSRPIDKLTDAALKRALPPEFASVLLDARSRKKYT